VHKLRRRKRKKKEKRKSIGTEPVGITIHAPSI